MAFRQIFFKEANRYTIIKGSFFQLKMAAEWHVIPSECWPDLLIEYFNDLFTKIKHTHQIPPPFD